MSRKGWEYESEKNYLKDLKISGYDINFSKKKQNYEIKINNESSLDILATPNNSTATVSITGNKNLKNNSKVTIKVVDEDNKTREYIITIKKSLIESLTYKEYILFTEFLIIFILILVIIFRPKNNTLNKSRNVVYKPSNKVCKNCGTINNANSKVCYVCGKRF